jgi:nitroreductase
MPTQPGLFSTLYTARALRRFKPDPVPDEVLFQLLDAAIRAPSGQNAQDWRFLIVRSREMLADMQRWSRHLEAVSGTWWRPADRRATALATTVAAQRRAPRAPPRRMSVVIVVLGWRVGPRRQHFLRCRICCRGARPRARRPVFNFPLSHEPSCGAPRNS